MKQSLLSRQLHDVRRELNSGGGGGGAEGGVNAPEGMDSTESHRIASQDRTHYVLMKRSRNQDNGESKAKKRSFNDRRSPPHGEDRASLKRTLNPNDIFVSVGDDSRSLYLPSTGRMDRRFIIPKTTNILGKSLAAEEPTQGSNILKLDCDIYDDKNDGWEDMDTVLLPTQQLSLKPRNKELETITEESFVDLTTSNQTVCSTMSPVDESNLSCIIPRDVNQRRGRGELFIPDNKREQGTSVERGSHQSGTLPPDVDIGRNRTNSETGELQTDTECSGSDGK